MQINTLIGLKKQAQAEGWAKYIRTSADENALLKGYTFSYDHYDLFRFYCENFLVLSKGKWAGQPFTLMDFQDEVCGSLFGWIKAEDGLRRFRRGYVEMGKKNSKALALNTKIATPNGFKQMKDIKVGDSVFAVDGSISKVIAESEVFYNHDCFNIEFQNGEIVTCDAGHLWKCRSPRWRKQTTVNGKKERKLYVEKVCTTKELFEHQLKNKNPLISIPKANAIVGEYRDLEIDPYLLGYWLGDGSSAGARISVGKKDLNHLESELFLRGYKYRKKIDKTCFSFYVYGLNKENKNNGFHVKLKKLNLLKNKHIPEKYLFSDYNQRLELLRGLLDSDGMCSKKGQITFSNKNKTLAYQVKSLMCSLGLKATIMCFDAKIKKRFISKSYIVSTFSNLPVFRIKRKLERLKHQLHPTRQNWIYIKKITPVQSTPTKCISINHPSKLFLITDSFLATHNTTTASAIGLYMFDGDGEPSPEVFCVANDRDQAGILWGISADMVEASPELSKRINVIRSTRRMLVGTSSCFNAWSSDQSSKDGPNIHCAIVDELHEWKGNAGREFWRKIRYGGIARAQPLCPLVITTAGDDKFSLCYEQHTYAKKILTGVADSDFAYFACIYGVDEERIRKEPDYWKSEEAWKEANPAYEIILKKEDFEADIIEAENDPTSKQAFLRYRLGYWVESSSPWIDINVYEESASTTFTEDDLAGQLCFAGFDLSSVDDFTAISYIFPRKIEDVMKYFVLCRVYIPEERLRERIEKLDVNFLEWVQAGWIRLTPGNTIDHEFIFEEIKADSTKFQVKEIGYDRHDSAWIVQQCIKQLPHIEMFPISQSSGMSDPTKALYSVINQKRLEHGKNPVLRWAVSNAVPEIDRRGNIHLHKGKSKDKIDPLIATIMAFNQAYLGELEQKKKVNFYDSENFVQKMKDLEGVKVE